MTWGIIGCLLGFVLLGSLTYKGWHIAIASLAGALIVALTNSLPVTNAYLEYYLPGMGGFLSSYFGQFLFGAMLAEICCSRNIQVFHQGKLFPEQKEDDGHFRINTD